MPWRTRILSTCSPSWWSPWKCGRVRRWGRPRRARGTRWKWWLRFRCWCSRKRWGRGRRSWVTWWGSPRGRSCARSSILLRCTIPRFRSYRFEDFCTSVHFRHELLHGWIVIPRPNFLSAFVSMLSYPRNLQLPFLPLWLRSAFHRIRFFLRLFRSYLENQWYLNQFY